MPCSVNDVSIDIPDGPSGPAIAGFGTGFTLDLPSISFLPPGIPEDLLALLDKLQFMLPSGILKPQMSLNFGKDIFDAIMKLIDNFLPFLMLYKFFLPILNLIICIIEVLCALPNPFKVISALKKLFKKCLPAFLNLFPIFALIIMIISLLLLLLALIEYIIDQILKLILLILRNVSALFKSFDSANKNSVIAIAKKLGALLCVFQNLFVLLSIFNIIIQVFKDILGMVFAIPPCDDDNPDGCCTTDVCPAIVRNGDYTRTTGTLQYLNKVGLQTSLVLPEPFGNFNFDLRQESWQIFDPNQEIAQKFINIIDGYDVLPGVLDGFPLPKPIFFPTDVVYTAATAPKQAAYTIDLKMLYSPISWGRMGETRVIEFKDCIVTTIPFYFITQYDTTPFPIANGVLYLAGGTGYESDGKTVLKGYDPDGLSPIDAQATLENFIHKPARFSSTPDFSPNDGYTFQNIEYTFKPHIETLISKNLVTAGCEPSLSLDKGFINSMFVGDVALKTKLLTDLVNGADNNLGDGGVNVFPDPNAAQECLATALSALRVNLNPQGVANFQATAMLCLQKLKDDTNSAIGTLISIGFDACSSDFTLFPKIQFTSRPIKVSVNIKERNGLPLTTGLSSEIVSKLQNKIKAHTTFGNMGNFSYDGYQAFVADINSDLPGTGQAMISFDNNIFCSNNIPDNNDESPTHTLQALDYTFVYAPSGALPPTAEGDTDGKPRRTDGDLSPDNGAGSNGES